MFTKYTPSYTPNLSIPRFHNLLKTYCLNSLN